MKIEFEISALAHEIVSAKPALTRPLFFRGESGVVSNSVVTYPYHIGFAKNIS